MDKVTHMKLTLLLPMMFLLLVPSGAQGIDLGGLLNQAVQEAVKNALQPAPARQQQNNVPPQQGNTTGGDRQSTSTVISNQPQNRSPSQSNVSGLSHESQSPEIKVVEVEGIGETQSDAKEDAYRNAVEKAVGSFVSADLVAKNDQLIKDEVLNYSAGYIEKSEILSEGKRPDGLYFVKLKASVAKKKLTRQLEELNIATADVDSESLFAEAITTTNQRDSAQKIWARLFDDFWRKAFEVEVDGKPQLAYGPDDNVQAYFEVVARFNKQFLQELENTMSATGSSPRRGRFGSYPDDRLDQPTRKSASSVCLVYDTTQLRSSVTAPNIDFVYENSTDDYRSRPFQYSTPFNVETGPDVKNPLRTDDIYCVDVPLNYGAWKLPCKNKCDHITPSPSGGGAFSPNYDLRAIQKDQGIPHILLTLHNRMNEIVASEKGILLMNSSYMDSFTGQLANTLIFIGDRVDVRYIPVKLKRNQLQDISKVEVRAVGKLIYVDPATFGQK